MDLDDEELKATRIMNGANKSLGYVYKLEQRIKELEEVEQEHKKENGELRERVKELEYKYNRALSDLVQAEHKNKELEEENEMLENTKTNCPEMNTSGFSCELKRNKNIEPILINNKMYFIDKYLYEDLLKDIKINYIPKSKVKEKIKELETEHKQYENEWEIKDEIQAQIDILQELLEG